jgi:hypothetical protein
MQQRGKHEREIQNQSLDDKLFSTKCCRRLVASEAEVKVEIFIQELCLKRLLRRLPWQAFPIPPRSAESPSSRPMLSSACD